MNDNNLPDDVSEMFDLTQSQKDRLLKKEKVQSELMDFMSSTMKKISAEGSVKEILLEHILAKVQDEQEDLSLRDLVKAYEVLSGADNELAKGLFEIIKGQQKVQIESSLLPSEIPSGNDNGLTKDELLRVKDLMDDLKTTGKVIDYMNKIKNTEFSEEDNE